jgi:metallo-beta-lactamase superfamily protein
MSLRLSFHGAARSVTGSCFRLETDRGQVLIDCGLFQGSKTEKELNYRSFAFPPKGITAVILSHAHIDHAGLLPKLVKGGFQGRIYATPATTDLAGVMLLDSAHIQEIEVEQLNRRNAHWNRNPVEPIYVAADAGRITTPLVFSSAALTRASLMSRISCETSLCQSRCATAAASAQRGGAVKQLRRRGFAQARRISEPLERGPHDAIEPNQKNGLEFLFN